MSILTLPASIIEHPGPDGRRWWTLRDRLVLRADPQDRSAEAVLTWKVTLFGVNDITADVTVTADDLDLTVNCWCTLIVAATEGGLGE